MGIETAIIAVALVAAAASTYATVSAANAQADAAKFNAKVARNNAIAEQHQLSFDMQRLKDRRKRIVASQQAKLAKSGVRLDEGSAEALKIDQEVQLRMDEIARQYQGRTAIGAQRSQAALFKAEAANARKQAVIGGSATALSGLAGAGATAANLGVFDKKEP